MDERQHGAKDVLLGLGQLEDLFLQTGRQGTLGGKGENQKIRALRTVYDEFVKFQRLVEDKGAAGEIVHPLVARHAGLSIPYIEAFPEIVGFSGECEPLFVMGFKERVHICDSNLFSDWVGYPGHELCASFVLISLTAVLQFFWLSFPPAPNLY